MYIMEDRDQLESQTSMKFRDCWRCSNLSTTTEQLFSLWRLLFTSQRGPFGLSRNVDSPWAVKVVYSSQHTLKSIHLFLGKAKFKCLKLRMMPAVEVYKKVDCRPIPCHASVQLAKASNAESKRVPLSWHCQKIRQTTICPWQRNRYLLVSVGAHPLFFLFTLLTSTSVASLCAGKNDTINLFLPLPDVSLDGTSHRAHHRGIDFMYNPSPKP
jgi:hypothetical protein